MEVYLSERYAAAKKEIVDMGLHVSAGSWIDIEINRYYVCSSETIGEHKHPQFEISGNGTSEWKTF